MCYCNPLIKTPCCGGVDCKPKRKTIKITLPHAQVETFDHAKKKAEDAAMMKLTDTQFASRLIQWAIEQSVNKA